MPRKKKSELLALPAQAGKDIKAVTSIVERWTGGVEDIMKDLFTWAKKHKFLVITVVGLLALKRYWLDEPETEDEDYD